MPNAGFSAEAYLAARVFGPRARSTELDDSLAPSLDVIEAETFLPHLARVNQVIAGSNVTVTQNALGYVVSVAAGAGGVTDVTASSPLASSGGATPDISLTGLVPLANGGTNANLTASIGGIFYSTAAEGAILSGTATAGQMLRSGASAAPAWSTATFPATATGTGTILRADGTNWAASTNTYPNTTSVNHILYATSANVIGSSASLTFNGTTLSSTFAGNLTGDVTGNISGNSGTVTVADEAADTSCFIAFVTAATGSLGVKSNANLLFDSSTGAVTFGGAIAVNGASITTDDLTFALLNTTATTINAFGAATTMTLGGAANIGTFVGSNVLGHLYVNTSDAGDTGELRLASTNALGSTRGAYIRLFGNESAATGGIVIAAGDVVGGIIYFYTGNAVEAMAIARDGSITMASTLGVTGQITGDLTGDVTGNADTATSATSATTAGSAATLTTPRTIGNVSFDGSANIVPETITSINEATDTTCFPLFITASGTQSLQPKNNTGLTYNSNTNNLGATTFTGNLTGNVTGNVSGSSGSTTGNAATVTVAAETTDTSCSILFSTAVSGSLAPKTNTNLTFNSNTGVLTSASAVLTTADINGGTLDGVTIGGSTAAAATVTTLAVNGAAITTDDTTFAVLNTTATTINAFGAATTINIGDASAKVRIGNTATMNPAADNLIVGPGTGAAGMTFYSATTSTGSIYFAEGDTGTDRFNGYIEYNHNTDSLLFGIATSTRGTWTTTGLLLTGSLLSSSATAGIGYTTGAGGAVTQLTSKSTATPAINKMCGTVTMNNAALAAATAVTHTLSNSSVAAGDNVICVHTSGGTLGAYTIVAAAAAGSATVTIRNNTAGSLSEAIVYKFTVIKGVTA